ncbi:hypothetical protein T484DRAFT_1821966 [Baffinella frigidus]|nr:hypothetical protein T484DRAFT_1821966 [Cryptophyta sp. CCMP2293]
MLQDILDRAEQAEAEARTHEAEARTAVRQLAATTAASQLAVSQLAAKVATNEAQKTALAEAASALLLSQTQGEKLDQEAKEACVSAAKATEEWSLREKTLQSMIVQAEDKARAEGKAGALEKQKIVDEHEMEAMAKAVEGLSMELAAQKKAVGDAEVGKKKADSTRELPCWL